MHAYTQQLRLIQSVVSRKVVNSVVLNDLPCIFHCALKIGCPKAPLGSPTLNSYQNIEGNINVSDLDVGLLQGCLGHIISLLCNYKVTDDILYF